GEQAADASSDPTENDSETTREPSAAPVAGVLKGAELPLSPNALPDAPAPVRSASAAVPSPPGTSTSGIPTASAGSAQRAVELARRGSHVDAIVVAEANGFAATCDMLVASDLLALADSARYAGRFERATQALEAIRRRFPRS